MKVFLRILVVLVVIFLIGFYSGPSIQENELLQNEPVKLSKDDSAANVPTDLSDGLTRPKTGISVYIGKPLKEFIASYGQPDRIDPGYYDLEWLIYQGGAGAYIQVAVKNETVKAIYVLGENIDLSPFKIGQPLEEIYRFTMITSEIIVEDDNGTYQFELSEQDLHTRLLVPFGDMFGQLFVDRFSGNILAVYFMDKETLLEQRPYELVYRGDLPAVPVEQDNQSEIDSAAEQQIFDMTNVIREQRGISQLDPDFQLAKVAKEQSRLLYDDSLLTNDSPQGTLQQRLSEGVEAFDEASENSASNFTHSFSVLHAWMNSEGHRDTMLKEEFTHLGAGVYYLFFTQDFIKYDSDEKSEEE
ncbi:CAP-associated domain-containing protein [Jeotgalibacillus sp. ET6]|uniref:CAP domain-containing protein n=1 Tax=Jeotgalibacillus sp. ET6 TaxID=3037260 RepID=UPI0024182575|nr:CAP-associated domain-containing protein [Jeotgalibacillus sp. ET6]MDG5470170.1 CAP-associated domain-containing protein [Jeotgalibacillus sp. ET6]